MATCFIVDDHPFTTEGIKATVSLLKGQMTCIGDASNVDDAVTKVSQLKPDLILVDHFINEKTGLDLIELLKEKFSASRFILVSQLDNKALVKRYLEKGVRGLVSKTSAHEELSRAILSLSEDTYVCPFYEKILQSQDSSDALTPREVEVVRYIAQGKTNKEIGQSLLCSEFTIKSHKASIMRKLNFTTSVEIGVWALKNKVV